jgi:hypothetical protein
MYHSYLYTVNGYLARSQQNTGGYQMKEKEPEFSKLSIDMGFWIYLKKKDNQLLEDCIQVTHEINEQLQKHYDKWDGKDFIDLGKVIPE